MIIIYKTLRDCQNVCCYGEYFQPLFLDPTLSVEQRIHADVKTNPHAVT